MNVALNLRVSWAMELEASHATVTRVVFTEKDRPSHVAKASLRRPDAWLHISHETVYWASSRENTIHDPVVDVISRLFHLIYIIMWDFSGFLLLIFFCPASTLPLSCRAASYEETLTQLAGLSRVVISWVQGTEQRKRTWLHSPYIPWTEIP